jgi:hypothetical protein
MACAFWWFGGWLLATHGFTLRRNERLTIGFGIGLVSFLWIANILAHWLQLTAAFLGASLLVTLAGLGLARVSKRPIFDWKDLQSMPLWLAGAALGWLFLQVSQGLAIFDDYVHLPLISTMAAGNIPPRYFVNSPVNFVYHYGFHLLGASLMRLAGLSPWGAFDLSKAILWAFAILLAYLIGRRWTGKTRGGIYSAFLVIFASGTRYLLLLFPAKILQAADSLIKFQDLEASMGVTFSNSLLRNWPLDGGPPFPFTFGLLSGINRPLAMSHGGLNMMGLIILFLIWLLAQQIADRRAILILAILFAFWGLTWETSLGLIFIGLGLLTIRYLWKERSLPQGAFRASVTAALIAIPLILLQGGLPTELARKFLATNSVAGGGAQVAQLAGFSLRWPPAIVSAHLGPLKLFSLWGLIIALFELGPVILFTPWITRWAWKRGREQDWFFSVLILSAWAGFILPILASYQSDTNIPRITEHAMLVWTLFLGFMVWETSINKTFRHFAQLGLGLMIIGGGILFGISLTAAPVNILSYNFDIMDAQVQRDLWDRLPEDAEIFDPAGWRATALTGRLTRKVTGDLSFGNQDRAEWEELRQSPEIDQFLAQGYPFVYVDDIWWNRVISGQARIELSQSCIQVVTEYRNIDDGRFRRMLDLRGCAQ